MADYYVEFDFRETKNGITFLPVKPDGPIVFVYQKTVVSINHKIVKIIRNGKSETIHFNNNITHVDDYNIWSTGDEYMPWRDITITSPKIPFTTRVNLMIYMINNISYIIFYLQSPNILLFTIYNNKIDYVHEKLTIGPKLQQNIRQYMLSHSNSVRLQDDLNNFAIKNEHRVKDFHSAIDKLLEKLSKEKENYDVWARAGKKIYYDIQPIKPIKRVVYQPEEESNVEDEPISKPVSKPRYVIPKVQVSRLEIRVPVLNIRSQITQVSEFYPGLRWSNHARLGSFKVSYFNSYDEVSKLASDDHRISHIGVIPYVVSPTGVEYLVSYKKKSRRFCGGCVGDIGGGVKANTTFIDGLHKEIYEELSASKSPHTQQLKDHIMEELEKTNRLTTVRYSKYKSTIPFGIMYISDSYFNYDGTRHSLYEDQTYRYKVYYILMLVPIDGRYVNLTQINEAIELDPDTEIDRVEIMSERQFLDVMTNGKLDTDYNMAFQMLKNIGFTDIHHNCNLTYQDLYEKVRSQMLIVKQWYPYFQKYSNSEIDTRIQNSDYTRLCYLSQKLDLIELMKP